ncbi:cupin-like domain-containing protein [Asticcacaulis sp. 201]|uniref:cupin-like domain-containing protein n=1 Tax=Asticcacaulis sp. 201 TaxID=3028787 RepID=UPI002916D4AF|nr:cupin-like domain-containing protein [Asticcacaulis sp. 201]MDV6330827.1 cupin-like domain-containing protein [Asticcacaulis sp. 201]
MQSCKSAYDVTVEAFTCDIAPVNEPVVLRGLCADWPSVKAAHEGDSQIAAYLKSRAVSGPIEFLTAPPTIKGEFFYGDTLQTRNFQKARAPFGDVLDQLLALAAEATPPAIYIQSTPVDGCLPAFRAGNSMPLLPDSVSPRVWIGNTVRIQTHYDLSDNIAVVVAGKRRFTLFPPNQLPNLYVGPFEQTLAGSPVSLADIEMPDFARFPRLRDALETGRVAELDPGDALFIPYGWWHHVRSLSAFNVLVNYWWNESPSHLQAPYGALLHAMLMVRDMPERQRDVWKTMFDHFVFGARGEAGAHLKPEDRGMMARLTATGHESAFKTFVNGLVRQVQSLR